MLIHFLLIMAIIMLNSAMNYCAAKGQTGEATFLLFFIAGLVLLALWIW